MIKDKCLSLMIVKMRHFTPEFAQNFAYYVLGVPFKVLNYFVVVKHYILLWTKVTKVIILEKNSIAPKMLHFTTG